MAATRYDQQGQAALAIDAYVQAVEILMAVTRGALLPAHVGCRCLSLFSGDDPGFPFVAPHFFVFVYSEERDAGRKQAMQARLIEYMDRIEVLKQQLR